MERGEISPAPKQLCWRAGPPDHDQLGVLWDAMVSRHGAPACRLRIVPRPQNASVPVQNKNGARTCCRGKNDPRHTTPFRLRRVSAIQKELLPAYCAQLATRWDRCCAPQSSASSGLSRTKQAVFPSKRHTSGGLMSTCHSHVGAASTAATETCFTYRYQGEADSGHAGEGGNGHGAFDYGYNCTCLGHSISSC